MMQPPSRGRALGALAALLALGPSLPAGAQSVSPGCAAQGLLQDACQKAADIFTVIAPQLGTSIAGGNALLGDAGALGRIGRIAVALRVTGLSGDLPEVEDQSVVLGPAQRDEFTVRDQWVGLPQLDLAIGVFGGVPLGFTHVGAVDVILSGMYVPEIDEEQVRIRTPDGEFKLGYGARVALLQETAGTPSVAVSYMRRELPELGIAAQIGDDDSVSIGDTRVRADAWRVVAGKSLGVLSVAVGAGQDRYDTRAALSAAVREGGVRVTTGAPVPFAQDVTRTTVFADLGLRLGVVVLVGEIGRVSGGELATYNTFAGGAADAARTYASAGLRIGF